MNGREALKALAEGKRVRAEVARSSCGGRAYIDATNKTVAEVLSRNDWELVEEPATDAELISEMNYLEVNAGRSKPGWAEAMNYCARMLKTRKVKP